MSQSLQKVASIGESRDKELLKSASSYVYQNKDGVELMAHVFYPATGTRENLPAIACFHGGFWDTAMVTQFIPHCHHFASRNAVAITFEYRVSSKHQTSPLESIEDAKAAFHWLAENSESLGIDTTNIAILGAAGGAWLALHISMLPKKIYTPPFEPKGLVLYSALVNTTPKGLLSDRFPDPKTAKKLSPTSLIRRKLPPMLFIHGKSDRSAPYKEVTSFRKRVKWRGNHCKLIDFVGAEHSFFNFNVSHHYFEMTINAADAFLVRYGILEEPPEES